MRKILFVLLSCLLLSGCFHDGGKYDGKLVKDKDGIIYKLKHNLGDTYFVRVVHNPNVTLESEDVK